MLHGAMVFPGHRVFVPHKAPVAASLFQLLLATVESEYQAHFLHSKESNYLAPALPQSFTNSGAP